MLEPGPAAPGTFRCAVLGRALFAGGGDLRGLIGWRGRVVPQCKFPLDGLFLLLRLRSSMHRAALDASSSGRMLSG